MSDTKAEVTVKCVMRVDGGKRSCPWELTATSIDEAAEMHRLHLLKVHS